MGNMEKLQLFFDKYGIQKKTYTELSKSDDKKKRESDCIRR